MIAKGFGTKVMGYVSAAPTVIAVLFSQYDSETVIKFLVDNGVSAAAAQLGVSLMIHYYRNRAEPVETIDDIEEFIKQELSEVRE